MPSCVMRKCTNYGRKSNKVDGITYHKFPSDELVCHKWTAVVRKQRSEHDWFPSKFSTVCSDHFTIEDKYTSGKGRMLLKKTAVPILKKHVSATLRSDSPNSLEEEDITDMSHIFDSPIKFALEERIRRLVFEKMKLQKENKVLKQQNKRLKTKCSNMKIILKKVINRGGIS